MVVRESGSWHLAHLPMTQEGLIRQGCSFSSALVGQFSRTPAVHPNIEAAGLILGLSQRTYKVASVTKHEVQLDR